MNYLKKIKYNFILISFITGLSACGGGNDGGATPPPTSDKFTYSTTSTKGDYSEWTLSGDELNVLWQVVADDGDIDYIFDINANCAAPSATGERVCTISSSDCTDGVMVCPAPPSGTLNLMEVPGVALFVTTDKGMVSAQLHVGFVKNDSACSDDVSGDYSFIRTGLGLRDSFGLYRSDANFVNIVHADFGFKTTDDNATQTLSYNTGTEAETLSDDGCVDGVRKRSVGGNALRSMITGSGLFVVDLPAGEGGLLAFKVDKAATLADFANKNFGGISFPDNDDAQTFSAQTTALSSNKVDISATFENGDVQNRDIKTLATVATLTSPAYPDFTLAPTGYDSSVLFLSYANTTTIPGLFKFDQLSDDGRVIMIAMKFNNKIIAIGMVYNLRTTTDIDPSAGDGVTTFSEDGLYNTGNFVLFEK